MSRNSWLGTGAIFEDWLNGWVFVYKLSGCGFESRCSHLHLSMPPKEILHHHLNQWACYITGFMCLCIYILQYIPEFLHCLYRESILILLLHCDMDRHEHAKYFHEYIFTFSFYRLFYEFFKYLRLSFIPDVSIVKHPLRYLRYINLRADFFAIIKAELIFAILALNRKNLILKIQFGWVNCRNKFWNKFRNTVWKPKILQKSLLKIFIFFWGTDFIC